MPRDYKNIAAQEKDRRSAWISPVLIFLAGLASGLLAAWLIFLFYGNYPAKSSAAPEEAPTEEPTPAIADKALPKPRFDFYKILPHREVNISEWVAAEQDTEIPAMNDEHVYILQVGSFTQQRAAEQLRAQLALMGIYAEIQRVVINGRDARHRVRIGPYQNSAQMEDTRLRLRENDLDFMVLRLRLDEQAAAE